MSQIDYLQKALKTNFHYNNFRLGQREIIEDILAGKDVLGILPTGSGKSICYQLPALLLKGTTLVVSPLIALMMDQVKQLKVKQFKDVIAINSFIPPMERRKIYQQLNHYRLIYVSPELLQQDQFMFHLKQLQTSLFVVDEAHCISQWGHEFRPDYMKLNQIISQLGNPPVLALSATATPRVQRDIMESLDKKKMIKHIYPIDKENIIFSIYKVEDPKEKAEYIMQFIKRYKVPTLIYFSSRNMAEQMADRLSSHDAELQVAYYHGGMDQMDRVAVQQQFMNDQLQVICCTNAFGMGIDKHNIRLVIHYHMPTQIESFVQEAGRAGRDGELSLSVLFYATNDIFLPKQIVNKELPDKETVQSVFQLLFTLYSKNKPFIYTEEQIEQLLPINIVQWRFLHTQFEKHGIIRDNKINYEKSKWRNVYLQIEDMIQKRKKTKKAKLREMFSWIQEEKCLRESLYQPFQSTYTKPEGACCSNCGFTLESWKPQVEFQRQIESTTWLKKLQHLFSVGDDSASK